MFVAPVPDGEKALAADQVAKAGEARKTNKIDEKVDEALAELAVTADTSYKVEELQTLVLKK